MSTSNRRTEVPHGFTIIELVIALVLASIFAGIIFQLVRGQGTFVAFQSARQEVQQNSRAAVEIIGTEMRATMPQALIQADDASIEFMSPRFFGLACPGATSAQMDIIAPTVDATALAVGSTTGLMVNVVGEPNPSSYVPVAGTTPRAVVTGIASLAPSLGQCAAMAPASAGVTAYRLTGSGFPVAVAGFQAGRSVAVYDIVRYAVGSSEGENWVQRWNPSSGATPQPFVGPLESPNNRSGLQFRYFATGSATPMATAPGNVTATLRTVSRIRVVVHARSRGTATRLRQTESDSVTVFLRNQ